MIVINSLGVWCNGNTTVFGTVTGGSIPSIPGLKQFSFNKNNMTWFAIAVLCILILVILLYLSIALYSFWVKLPKWLRVTTWIFFIVYSVLSILWFLVMKASLVSPSMILILINIALWIYMLVNSEMPKWLRIVVWVIACILLLINAISCFMVPAMYGTTTLDMQMNWL